MTSFDAIRAKYPHLGFALYAYEPGGAVTLECLTPSAETFTFVGPTADAAIAEAFPEDMPEEPPAVPAAETATTTDISVFD